MNILLYVMTMLMLLTLLTYTRIESYRSFAVVEKQFVIYMEEKERDFVNSKAEELYKKTSVKAPKTSTPEPEPNKPKPEPTSPGTGRLSIYPLIHSNDREANPEAFSKTLELTKKLIVRLYQSQPFYQEIEEKRPHFVDDLLHELVNGVEKLPPEKAITKITDLANFKFENDPELDLAFYEMLKEIPKNAQKVKEKSVIGKRLYNESLEQEEPYEEPQAEVLESQPKDREFSLMDYLTLKANSKVRVYLASRVLLLAIYEDPIFVEQILEARNALYARIKNNPEEKKELSEKFAEQFKRGQALHYESLLDFSVTGTNPKGYE